MVKIALVVSPLPRGVLKESVLSSPPLNATYLAAVAEDAGHDVEVVDCPASGIDYRALGGRIASLQPDLIGITSLCQTYQSALKSAHVVKESLPRALVVLGGPQATFIDKETLCASAGVDVVVRGEGEKTFLELARNVGELTDLEDIAGITFRKDGEAIRTSDRGFIDNLDELPFPAYHFIPIERYGALGKRIFLVLSSRGCPHRCSFCVMRLMDGRRFRARSPKNVVDELEYIHEWGADSFSFCDECFTLDSKRVFKICDEMRKRRIDMPWDCQSRVDLVSREVLKEIKKAGCQLIGFGVESGSQKILNAMRKDVTVEQNERAIRLAKEVGIPATANFMIGYPGETPETLKQTFSFIHRTKPDIVFIMVATPFPGTDFYRLVEDMGWKLSKDWNQYDVVTPVFETPNLDAERILQMRSEFYKKWYSLSYIIRNALKRNFYNRYMARFAIDYNIRRIKSALGFPPAH